MNWDIVGAVAELLGAAGVIGSLVYVARQMKSSTLASQVESKLRVTDKMADFQNQLIEYPHLMELMIAGRRNYTSLDRDQRIQFANLALKACWFLSAAHFMYRKGSIDKDDWHEFRATCLYWASGPGFREWWQTQGHLNFAGAFKRFMEEEIAQAIQASPAGD
jgi:hypothetical protein